MPHFTSDREKQLWFYSLMVLLAIISTLIIGQPLIDVLGNQDIQAVIFLLVLVLVGITILIYGLKKQVSKTEITICLGLTAVYIMFFLRLGLSERSHLIEYSILAIFIHMALVERSGPGNQVWRPALIAFVITLIIGTIDECIQLFIPDRVFDPNDLLFNSLASLMAIGSGMILQWIRKKKSSS